jgi:type I restriction enzyme S subunit
MELRLGYKHTEAGVIPEDWDAVPLGGFVRITSGDSPSLVRFTSIGKPYFKVEQLSNGDKYLGVFSTPYHFIDGKTVPRRSVIFAKRGAAIALNKIRILSEESFMDTNLMALTPKDGLDFEYLYYGLGYIGLWRFADTTSVPQINNKHINPLPFPLPKETEQREIASALNDVDVLLATLDQMIAKKRDLRQAAMQQLLTGKTRLPGFSGEWEARTLFELAECKKEFFDDGDWIESEHITTEGIRLIQTGNIGIGSFVEKEDKKYINEASFSSLRCKQLKQGDLLICRLAEPAGRACVLGDIGEERIVTSVDVTIFRPPPELADRTFLVQAFSTADWFRAVSDRSGGTTHKRISRGALGRLSINLPPVPEQSAIARVLSDMDADLSALEARRYKARNIKQAMMQELLTGKTRLVEAHGANT